MTANGFRAENRELRAEVSRMENTITALRAEVEKWQKATSNRDREIIKVCDERDALRAENERLKEWNSEIALNAREFAAENERLRAALGDIHAAAGNNHLIANIARAALEGKHE